MGNPIVTTQICMTYTVGMPCTGNDIMEAITQARAQYIRLGGRNYEPKKLDVSLDDDGIIIQFTVDMHKPVDTGVTPVLEQAIHLLNRMATDCIEDGGHCIKHKKNIGEKCPHKAAREFLKGQGAING